MNDLENVIQQAQEAGLTAVYYCVSSLVADGRFTLLAYPGLRPHVNVNPAAVEALVEACEAAGIKCEELKAGQAKITI